MRSRTIREGSVGLLLLLGVGCFGALILWLGGLTLGKRSYAFVVDFADAAGLREGAPVRYRGVEVGKVSAVTPGANGVAVTIEIAPADQIMPADVLIEANQSGLIGETSIDITPQSRIQVGGNIATPLDADCNPEMIICDRSRLQGQIGVSFNELIRSTTDFTERFGNPIFLENINSVIKNTATATEGVTQLSQELAALSKSVREELGTFSSTASSLGRAADQISTSVDRVANQASVLTNQFGSTSREFSYTADQIRESAAQVSRLTSNVNNLVNQNRGNIVDTLDNLSQTSIELRTAVRGLSPVLGQVQQGQLLRNLETLSANAAQASVRFRSLSDGQFFQNLEVAAANAAEASQGLRQLSSGQLVNNLETLSNNAAEVSASLRDFSDPENLLVLQQTLDSARATFQNAQKITADLDDLTGDPRFRENFKQLVNGLSDLVSSTERLQHEAQVAQTLVPMANAAHLSAYMSEKNELKKQFQQPSPALDPWLRPSMNTSWKSLKEDE